MIHIPRKPFNKTQFMLFLYIYYLSLSLSICSEYLFLFEMTSCSHTLTSSISNKIDTRITEIADPKVKPYQNQYINQSHRCFLFKRTDDDRSYHEEDDDDDEGTRRRRRNDSMSELIESKSSAPIQPHKHANTQIPGAFKHI